MSVAAISGSLPLQNARNTTARVKTWFETRPTVPQWLMLVGAALLFQLVWSTAGVAIVASIGSAPQKTSTAMRMMLEAPLLDVVGKQALGVLFEEVAFRVIPLGIALAIYRDNARGAVTAAFVLLSSVAFGYFHGLEWYRLTLQAVGGIVLSVVYLKTCGMSGRYWLRALATTFVLHMAINTTILATLRIAKGS